MGICATLTAGLVLAGCGGSAGRHAAGRSGDADPPHAGGSAMDAAVPARIAGLRLVDARGRATSLAGLRGKVVVIGDMMTLCQETCALDTANLVQAARTIRRDGLGGKVEFLSITVDPRRDTRAQLAAYRKLFRPVPADWRVLTGKPSALARLWKYFGVYYRRTHEDSPPAHNWRTGTKLTYDIEHADDVLFLDARGHERYLLDTPADVTAPDTLPTAMRRFLDADGRTNLAHPDAGAWTVPQAVRAVTWLARGHT